MASHTNHYFPTKTITKAQQKHEMQRVHRVKLRIHLILHDMEIDNRK